MYVNQESRIGDYMYSSITTELRFYDWVAERIENKAINLFARIYSKNIWKK